MKQYLFRNDYSFGAHPRVLEALAATNLEGNIGYGDDAYCDRAKALIRDLCRCPQAEVQFLIGGTQVNFTAIAAFLRPWEGVICAATAHVNGHEGGAVEATGHKLINIPVGRDGKLPPEAVAAAVKEYESPHVAWSTSPRPPRTARSTHWLSWRPSPPSAGTTTCCSTWTVPGWEPP